MRKHLQYGAGTGGTVHHQNGEKYQAAVRYGRVGIDVFQVGLYAGGESSVYNADPGQDQEDRCRIWKTISHAFNRIERAEKKTFFLFFFCHTRFTPIVFLICGKIIA